MQTGEMEPPLAVVLWVIVLLHNPSVLKHFDRCIRTRPISIFKIGLYGLVQAVVLVTLSNTSCLKTKATKTDSVQITFLLINEIIILNCSLLTQVIFV